MKRAVALMVLLVVWGFALLGVLLLCSPAIVRGIFPGVPVINLLRSYSIFAPAVAALALLAGTKLSTRPNKG